MRGHKCHISQYSCTARCTLEHDRTGRQEALFAGRSAMTVTTLATTGPALQQDDDRAEHVDSEMGSDNRLQSQRSQAHKWCQNHGKCPPAFSCTKEVGKNKH